MPPPGVTSETQNLTNTGPKTIKTEVNKFNLIRDPHPLDLCSFRDLIDEDLEGSNININKESDIMLTMFVETTDDNQKEKLYKVPIRKYLLRFQNSEAKSQFMDTIIPCLNLQSNSHDDKFLNWRSSQISGPESRDTDRRNKQRIGRERNRYSELITVSDRDTNSNLKISEDFSRLTVQNSIQSNVSRNHSLTSFDRAKRESEKSPILSSKNRVSNTSIVNRPSIVVKYQSDIINQFQEISENEENDVERTSNFE